MVKQSMVFLVLSLFTETRRAEEIEGDLLEQAQEYRDKLIESLSDFDDEIMEAYLSEAEISDAALIEAVRKATVELKLVPIFCGTALKNNPIPLHLNQIDSYFDATLHQ